VRLGSGSVRLGSGSVRLGSGSVRLGSGSALLGGPARPSAPPGGIAGRKLGQRLAYRVDCRPGRGG
ncbi:hypothetical protein, partial [Promicromonospora xylanilytica]